MSQEWMQKVVMQVSGAPQWVGRCGRMVERFEDEKGNWHARMESDDGKDWFWCPESMLSPVTLKPSFHVVND